MPEESKLAAVVYHYTSMDVMMSILKSQSVWATSIVYLNDLSEQEHFLKIILKHLNEDPQAPDDAANQAISQGIEQFKRNDFLSRPFVTSFSRYDDSLPQWRSYCPHGNGVAIGFRVDCLKRASLKAFPDNDVSLGMEVSFGEVEYIDPKSVSSIGGIIDEKAEMAMKRVHSYRSELKSAFAPRIFKRELELLACFKKDHSFSNEGECRLVVSDLRGCLSAIEFRPVRSTLVPYVVIGIPREGSQFKDQPDDSRNVLGHGERRHFVDRIVVGPTTNMGLSCQSVNYCCAKYGLNVEVVPSKIPFRDW
ncbi:MAG: DUF2971 domain-containing protein [Terracidiphilus sp.]|jgi:hypothetical protein